MKTIKILALSFSLILSNLCFGEQETPTQADTQIQELTLSNIDFEQLSQATSSSVGSLSKFIKKENSNWDSLLQAFYHRPILRPINQGLAYVNGELCHVGNYLHSTLYTVLEGPHYGLQTVVDYNGFVLFVNFDYDLEYISGGLILHHYYDDCKVVTGATQMIIF